MQEKELLRNSETSPKKATLLSLRFGFLVVVCVSNFFLFLFLFFFFFFFFFLFFFFLDVVCRRFLKSNRISSLRVFIEGTFVNIADEYNLIVPPRGRLDNSEKTFGEAKLFSKSMVIVDEE